MFPPIASATFDTSPTTLPDERPTGAILSRSCGSSRRAFAALRANAPARPPRDAGD